jgi:predicted AAA+ superfamily ATPase
MLHYGIGYAILRRRMEIAARFFTLPRVSFFLLGPRGTGKTTWLRNRLPDALWINLLQPDVYREMAARPERLRELVLGAPGRPDVVIDEVQRAPELLNVVHDLMEGGPPKRYVLTGSSARKLRRGGVDLLAGRAVVRTLHPFMAAEWPDFDLERNLQIGLLPLVVDSEAPEDVLKAYATLYLEQEVKSEGLVRNIGQFARFLEAASFSHGAVLNVSNVAREAQVNRRTAAGFVEILEDLLLSFRLEVFTRKAKRQTAAHPKFYFFDTGVFRSLRPRGPLDRPQEIEGAALEGLVAQHLRSWTAYTEGEYDLYTWRTRAGAEVDFVMYGPQGFWAIEVQNSRHVRPQDLRGLRAFVEEYPASRALLLYRGAERLRKGDVLCLPVGEFLSVLHPDRELFDTFERRS